MFLWLHQFIKFKESELLFVGEFHDLTDALRCLLEFLVGECAAVKLIFQFGFLFCQTLQILLQLFEFLLLLVCQPVFLGTAIPRHPA